jgi:oxygen-dependent protoporphyrinogen oxidase
MGSVVVVGGGVAGLACAWKLRRAGHEVQVLEREPVAGGRMRSEPCDGYRLERGAQFIASAYRNLHAVADALGLESRVRRLPHATTAVLRAGRLHAADQGSPAALLRSQLLSGRAKWRLARLPLELLRHRRLLDPWHPERAAPLDREDLASGLRRLVGEEIFEWLLAPAFSSTFDSDPEDLSLAFGLLAVRLVAGGFRLETFDEGPGLLTRALAAELDVRTGCEVTRVETDTQGVLVRYRTQGRDRRVLADAAVVALPGSLVTGVCPKLTPEERGFFESVRYVRGMIVHLLLDERPAPLRGLYGVAFPRPLGLDLYGLAVDDGKPGAAPPGAGLVNVALTAGASARLWQAPDAAVVDCALASLARTPVGRLAPRRAVVHRWDPMLPQLGAGALPRLARFLARTDRSPRLAFAGDYLVGPYTEAALTSGLRAASEIARAL